MHIYHRLSDPTDSWLERVPTPHNAWIDFCEGHKPESHTFRAPNAKSAVKIARNILGIRDRMSVRAFRVAGGMAIFFYGRQIFPKPQKEKSRI